ncbi:UNVERIFIED_CONTAM: Slc9a2 [Trichonephila clavipes]
MLLAVTLSTLQVTVRFGSLDSKNTLLLVVEWYNSNRSQFASSIAPDVTLNSSCNRVDVLYHMFEGYTEMGIPNILAIDYFSGIASFFVVSIGGTLIGILFGLITAFISKYTTSVPVIEPMFPFIMGYMSYLTAEMFHLSGILS